MTDSIKPETKISEMSSSDVLGFNFTVNTFCYSPLWNINLTWYPDNGQPPDFTPCFHKTVLVYTPAALLLLLSPIEFIRNNNPKNSNPSIPWGWMNILKLATKLFLCLSVVLEEIDLALIAYTDTGAIVGADFVAPAVKLASYLISIAMMVQSKKSGYVTSPTQWVYWLLHAICQGFTFGSVVNNPMLDGLTWTLSQDVLVIFDFACVTILLILYSMAEKSPTYTKLTGTNDDYFIFQFRIKFTIIVHIS